MHAGEEGHGIHEDLVDTVHMIRSDGRLAAVLAVQMFGLLAYNYAGAVLTTLCVLQRVFVLVCGSMLRNRKGRSTLFSTEKVLVVFVVEV